MLINSFKKHALALSSNKLPAEGFIVTKVTPILITLTITGLTAFTTTTVAATKAKGS